MQLYWSGEFHIVHHVSHVSASLYSNLFLTVPWTHYHTTSISVCGIRERVLPANSVGMTSPSFMSWMSVEWRGVDRGSMVVTTLFSVKMYPSSQLTCHHLRVLAATWARTPSHNISWPRTSDQMLSGGITKLEIFAYSSYSVLWDIVWGSSPAEKDQIWRYRWAGKALPL